MGKGTAQKDTIKDITSDSQVNSSFPYRWSPASLTFNIFFFTFFYIYIYNITRTTPNNHTTSKLTKGSKQKSRLGTASNKIKLRSYISYRSGPIFCVIVLFICCNVQFWKQNKFKLIQLLGRVVRGAGLHLVCGRPTLALCDIKIRLIFVISQFILLLL